MVTINFYQAAMNMRSGGSFASAISDAYFAADSSNQAILVTAFAELFQRFNYQPK
jgi:hypothetical protein